MPGVSGGKQRKHPVKNRDDSANVPSSTRPKKQRKLAKAVHDVSFTKAGPDLMGGGGLYPNAALWGTTGGVGFKCRFFIVSAEVYRRRSSARPTSTAAFPPDDHQGAAEPRRRDRKNIQPFKTVKLYWALQRCFFSLNFIVHRLKLQRFTFSYAKK